MDDLPAKLGNNANYASNNGPFGRRYGAKFADILDGMSNTALYAETLLGPLPRRAPPSTSLPPVLTITELRPIFPFATWDGTPEPGHRVPTGCNDPAINAWAYRGKQYYRGIVVTTYYSHTITPNAKAPRLHSRDRP